VIAKRILVSRDFARPRELDADREPFAASLRGKTAARSLQVAGDMSFDMVHDYDGLSDGQRRTVGRDGYRLSRRDRKRWVLVSVWGRAAFASHGTRPDPG
jgi:hypothetical protein